jgi:hypothetical protein
MSSIGPSGRGVTRRFADDGTPAYPAASPQPEPADAAAPAAPQEDRYVAASGEPNPFDAALESGLRSARSSLIDKGAEEAMHQIDDAAAGRPGWTPSGRNLLKEDLKLELDATLPGGQPPADPDAAAPPPPQGWSFSPIVKPTPRFTLDPQRGPLDGIGLQAGVQARDGGLRLYAQGSASVDQPLTDPRLGSVGGEAGFDYGRQDAFVPGDRLGVSGKASVTETFGPAAATTSVSAQLGASYMARDVLAPGDALSITAAASFRNDDLGGAQAPQYGVNSSLTYQF